MKNIFKLCVIAFGVVALSSCGGNKQLYQPAAVEENDNCSEYTLNTTVIEEERLSSILTQCEVSNSREFTFVQKNNVRVESGNVIPEIIRKTVPANQDGDIVSTAGEIVSGVPRYLTVSYPIKSVIDNKNNPPPADISNKTIQVEWEAVTVPSSPSKVLYDQTTSVERFNSGYDIRTDMDGYARINRANGEGSYLMRNQNGDLVPFENVQFNDPLGREVGRYYMRLLTISDSDAAQLYGSDEYGFLRGPNGVFIGRAVDGLREIDPAVAKTALDKIEFCPEIKEEVYGRNRDN